MCDSIEVSLRIIARRPCYYYKDVLIEQVACRVEKDERVHYCLAFEHDMKAGALYMDLDKCVSSVDSAVGEAFCEVIKKEGQGCDICPSKNICDYVKKQGGGGNTNTITDRQRDC